MRRRTCLYSLPSSCRCAVTPLRRVCNGYFCSTAIQSPCGQRCPLRWRRRQHLPVDAPAVRVCIGALLNRRIGVWLSRECNAMQCDGTGSCKVRPGGGGGVPRVASATSVPRPSADHEREPQGAHPLVCFLPLGASVCTRVGTMPQPARPNARSDSDSRPTRPQRIVPPSAAPRQGALSRRCVPILLGSAVLPCGSQPVRCRRRRRRRQCDRHNAAARSHSAPSKLGGVRCSSLARMQASATSDDTTPVDPRSPGGGAPAVPESVDAAGGNLLEMAMAGHSDWQVTTAGGVCACSGAWGAACVNSAH